MEVNRAVEQENFNLRDCPPDVQDELLQVLRKVFRTSSTLPDNSATSDLSISVWIKSFYL